MNIGKPVREIVVEPLECPLPAEVLDPATVESEPLMPAHKPHAEPVEQPA